MAVAVVQQLDDCKSGPVHGQAHFNWPALSDGRTGEGDFGRFLMVLVDFCNLGRFLEILIVFLWFSAGRGDGRRGERASQPPQSTSQVMRDASKGRSSDVHYADT